MTKFFHVTDDLNQALNAIKHGIKKRGGVVSCVETHQEVLQLKHIWKDKSQGIVLSVFGFEKKRYFGDVATDDLGNPTNVKTKKSHLEYDEILVRPSKVKLYYDDLVDMLEDEEVLAILKWGTTNVDEYLDEWIDFENSGISEESLQNELDKEWNYINTSWIKVS